MGNLICEMCGDPVDENINHRARLGKSVGTSVIGINGTTLEEGSSSFMAIKEKEK